MPAGTVRTMCPMNCHPTFCGMPADVSDEGRLLRVRGDQDNPDSRGFLCIRGRALPMLARAEPHAEVWIHPADASPRGITASRRVELVNQRGRFEAVARVTEDVLPGVLWARDGWPGLNTLTSGEACLGPEASDGLDPRIPGGQSAYDARVEVRPLPA